MYRLSIIISEIYNKFLPLAEQNGISLNLDMIDTGIIVEELTGIKNDVERAVSDAIGRSIDGEIMITVDSQRITITDTGTTLSRPICTMLSNKFIDVSSRVGFGTKVEISLSRFNDNKNSEISEKSTAISQMGDNVKTEGISTDSKR